MDLDYIELDPANLFPVVCVNCYKEFVGNSGFWDDPIRDQTYESESRTFICNVCWALEIDD